MNLSKYYRRILRLGLKFLEQGKFRLAHEFLKRILKQTNFEEIEYSDNWLRI